MIKRLLGRLSGYDKKLEALEAVMDRKAREAGMENRVLADLAGERGRELMRYTSKFEDMQEAYLRARDLSRELERQLFVARRYARAVMSPGDRELLDAALVKHGTETVAMEELLKDMEVPA